LPRRNLVARAVLEQERRRRRVADVADGVDGRHCPAVSGQPRRGQPRRAVGPGEDGVVPATRLDRVSANTLLDAGEDRPEVGAEAEAGVADPRRVQLWTGGEHGGAAPADAASESVAAPRPTSLTRAAPPPTRPSESEHPRIRARTCG